MESIKQMLLQALVFCCVLSANLNSFKSITVSAFVPCLSPSLCLSLILLYWTWQIEWTHVCVVLIIFPLLVSASICFKFHWRYYSNANRVQVLDKVIRAVVVPLSLNWLVFSEWDRVRMRLVPTLTTPRWWWLTNCWVTSNCISLSFLTGYSIVAFLFRSPAARLLVSGPKRTIEHRD